MTRAPDVLLWSSNTAGVSEAEPEARRVPLATDVPLAVVAEEPSGRSSRRTHQT